MSFEIRSEESISADAHRKPREKGKLYKSVKPADRPYNDLAITAEVLGDIPDEDTKEVRH
jgi:hypothetical protein